MKKKRTIISILVCVLMLAGIGCWRVMPPSYSRTLNANWGISLPVKALCEQVYEKDSGSSFHGDGIRYHVFSYEYEDYIDLMFAWAGTEFTTLRDGSYSEAAAAWLDEIEVPEDQRPDYENCAYWYKAQEDNSELIIFWDNNLNRLYIVESFL